MSKMSFFAATVAVAALTAAPALARDNTATPESAKQQMKPQHSKSWKSSSRMSRNHDRMAARQDWNGHDARNSNRDWNHASWDNGDRRWNHEHNWNESHADFWPGDVVGGAIGTAGAVTAAAIGTAGAVASAPFGGPYRDSYAYDRGYDVSYNYNGTAIPYSGSYAARNGFVCQPGTATRAPNGQLTICQ